ncbi:MAG: hypothetical protein HRT87_01140 [Legionellales bacterium]|nr:hypothetical protein [Legionellales bacterium]
MNKNKRVLLIIFWIIGIILYVHDSPPIDKHFATLNYGIFWVLCVIHIILLVVGSIVSKKPSLSFKKFSLYYKNFNVYILTILMPIIILSGLYFNTYIYLQTPFFDNLSRFTIDTPNTLQQISASLIYTAIACTIMCLFNLLNHFLLRITPSTKIKESILASCRSIVYLVYISFAKEMIFRWMWINSISALFFLLSKLIYITINYSIIVWISIFISSVFESKYIFNYIRKQSDDNSPDDIQYCYYLTIFNWVFSLGLGYLFCKYGLLSSIITNILYSLITRLILILSKDKEMIAE